MTLYGLLYKNPDWCMIYRRLAGMEERTYLRNWYIYLRNRGIVRMFTLRFVRFHVNKTDPLQKEQQVWEKLS